MPDVLAPVAAGAAPARPAPAGAAEVPPRQAECLAYLYAYWRAHGEYPTQREIAQAMGLRTNSAAIFVTPLERKGLVRRTHARHRTRVPRNLRLTAAGLAHAERVAEHVAERVAAPRAGSHGSAAADVLAAGPAAAAA